MFEDNASTLGKMEPNLSRDSAPNILGSKITIEYLSGVLVLLMHLGFTLIEAGSVRTKHTASVFVRNLTSLIISVLIFWILGYAFSFGTGHFFLGYSNFGLYHLQDRDLSHWFLHATLASVPPVLVGSALAERCHVTGLLAYTAAMSSLAYPVVVHWAWAPEGWLYHNGFTDVGGAGCLHVVAGAAALVATLIIGRRDGLEEGIAGHSLPMAAIGGGLVMVGMVGKQVGLAVGKQAGLAVGKQAGLAVGKQAGLAVSLDGSVGVVGRAATSCQVGGAAGGLVGVVAWKAWRKKWSYFSCLNGWLAGMVAVSAGGHLFVTDNSWASLIVGLVGGILYSFSVCVIHASVLQTSVLPIGAGECLEDNGETNKPDFVDDPVRAVSVHLLPGLWGLISVPLLTDRGLLGNEASRINAGELLGWQVGGAAAMVAWTVVLTVVAMYPLLPMGKLRISPEDEKDGMDRRKTEESAYATASQDIIDPSKSNLKKGHVRSKEFFKSTETLYASSQKLSGSSKLLAPKIVIHSPTNPPLKETILTQSDSPLYQPKDQYTSLVPTPPPMPSYLSMPNLLEEEKWPETGKSSHNMSTLPVPVARKVASKSKETSRNNHEAKLFHKESRPEPLTDEVNKSDFVAELTEIQKQKAELKEQRKKLRATSKTWTSPSLLQRGNDKLDLSCSALSSSSEGAAEAKVEKAIRNTQSFNYLQPVKNKPEGRRENCQEKQDVVFISDDTLLEETDDVIKKIGELTLTESPEEKREMRLSSATTPAKNLFKELTNNEDNNLSVSGDDNLV